MFEQFGPFSPSICALNLGCQHGHPLSSIRGSRIPPSYHPSKASRPTSTRRHWRGHRHRTSENTTPSPTNARLPVKKALPGYFRQRSDTCRVTSQIHLAVLRKPPKGELPEFTEGCQRHPRLCLAHSDSAFCPNTASPASTRTELRRKTLIASRVASPSKQRDTSSRAAHH
jgi:hypothetical protein